MNFAEFLAFRERQLATDPGLIDAGEINIYRALESLSPRLPDPPSEKLHRCHLAGQWVRYFGFPPEVASRTFVSDEVPIDGDEMLLLTNPQQPRTDVTLDL